MVPTLAGAPPVAHGRALEKFLQLLGLLAIGLVLWLPVTVVLVGTNVLPRAGADEDRGSLQRGLFPLYSTCSTSCAAATSRPRCRPTTRSCSPWSTAAAAATATTSHSRGAARAEERAAPPTSTWTRSSSGSAVAATLEAPGAPGALEAGRSSGAAEFTSSTTRPAPPSRFSRGWETAAPW